MINSYEDFRLAAIKNLCQQANEIMKIEGFPRSISFYSGTSGIGLELLNYIDSSEASKTLENLVEWTSNFEKKVERPCGLYFGLMGTALFLASYDTRLACRSSNDVIKYIIENVEGRLNALDSDQVVGLAGVAQAGLALRLICPELSDWCDELVLRCVQLLIDRIPELLQQKDIENKISQGIHVSVGFGHGTAGIASALSQSSTILTNTRIAADSATGSEVLLSHTLKNIDQLISIANSQVARPMAISWCQGLAGIGTSLTLQSPESHQSLISQIRDVCMNMARRTPMISQCCGLSGVGEFMLDTSQTLENFAFDYWLDAKYIYSLIDRRLCRDGAAPIYPDHSMIATGPGFGTGAAGVIAFYRRLSEGGARIFSTTWAKEISMSTPGKIYA